MADRALTDAVVASFDEADDPRRREVLAALVRHLHGFAREVALTEAEWAAAIGFLTRVGHRTDERRDEFVLLSDVLGLSMLTVGLNNTAPGATESTVLGPFFRDGAPEVGLGGDIAGGAPGLPCHVAGTVASVDGRPLPGARIDVWEADDEGRYDVQYPDHRTAGRGRLTAGADGAFRFWAVRPRAYPIPDDGPVGELLAATGRASMRPAHLHLRVAAPGHHPLTTHLFVAGDPHLDRDAVFGVRDSLVVEFADREPGTAPDGRAGPWCAVTFDLVLAPESP